MGISGRNEGRRLRGRDTVNEGVWWDVGVAQVILHYKFQNGFQTTAFVPILATKTTDSEAPSRLRAEAGGMADWDDEDAGDPDDGHAPPWATCRPGPHPPAAAPDPARLLLPLSQAEDLLSRLDARAGAAPEALRQGLVARLALAEAAAWLTQAGLPTHPHDLSLRAAGLTGSWSAASDLHRLERAMWPGAMPAQARYPAPSVFMNGSCLV